MSRPWKRELRLELRTSACYAALHEGGLHRRVLASASAPGRGAAAITAAIAALKRAESDWLTADARLTVADEYCDFLLLPDTRDHLGAERLAREAFAKALGHDELLVQSIALPGGSGRLAAAVDLADFDAWTDALLMAGATLQHLHPALTEDLLALQPRIPEADAVLVLLREEGASLVRLEEGVPTALCWERFEPGNQPPLDPRVQRFARQTGDRRQVVVYMLPPSHALCRFVLDLGPLAATPVTGIGGLTGRPPMPPQIGVAGLTQVSAARAVWSRDRDGLAG